jgi:hypothetical protein
VILSQLSSEGRKPVGAPTRQDDFGARLAQHACEVLAKA